MKTKHVINMITALALVGASCPAVSADMLSAKAADDWKTSYKAVLKNIEKTQEYDGCYQYELYDMDSDGLPEMFIYGEQPNADTMYSYQDGNAVLVLNGTLSATDKGKLVYSEALGDLYGISFSKDNSKIMISNKSGDGLFFNFFYQYTNGTLTQEKTFYECSYPENVFYRHEGSNKAVKITSAEYSSATSQNNASDKYELNDYTPFDDWTVPEPTTEPTTEEPTTEPTEPTTEKIAVSDEWKSAYKEAVENFDPSFTSAGYSLYDLTGDGQPELIINGRNDGSGGSYEIYTYKDRQAKPYYTGEAPYIYLDTSKNALIETYTTVPASYNGYRFLNVNDTDLSEIEMIEADNGKYTYTDASGNSSDITADKFQEILDSYSLDVALASDYGITDLSPFETTEPTTEPSSASTEPTTEPTEPTTEAIEAWRNAYKQIINDYKPFDDSAAWELYDVNDDGIPELFISDGTRGIHVYGFQNEQAVSLIDDVNSHFSFGRDGTIDASKDAHMLRNVYEHSGLFTNEFFQYDGTAVTPKDYFYFDDSSVSISTTDTYQLNGKNVSKNDYENAYAAYKTYEWVTLPSEKANAFNGKTTAIDNWSSSSSAPSKTDSDTSSGGSGSGGSSSGGSSSGGSSSGGSSSSGSSSNSSSSSIKSNSNNTVKSDASPKTGDTSASIPALAAVSAICIAMLFKKKT